MNINFNELDNFYLGNSLIEKAFLGDNLVWEAPQESGGVINLISYSNMEFGSLNWINGSMGGSARHKRTAVEIPVKPSTTYYTWHNLIPAEGSKMIEIAWVFYDINKNVIMGGSTAGDSTFITTPSNVYFIRVRYGLNAQSWDNDKYLLAESDTPVTWTPAPEDIT